MARLVVIPQLTLAQENLLKELAAESTGRLRLAGARLRIAGHLAMKGLAERAPGTQVFRLTQRGQDVAAKLERP